MNTKISGIIKSLLISYIVTMAILLLLSFLLLKFRLGENIISLGITLSYVISCFLGGMIAGKCFQVHRFLWGLLTGVIYFIFLTLISLAVNHQLTSDITHFFTVLFMCSFSGMLGGMLVPEK